MPATTNPSRLGQVNASGDALALFLKVFAGEVLTTFRESQVMMDKHLVRTINHGKSAQFPVVGTASTGYHTPGTNILDNSNSLLNNIKKNEKIINIDALLTSNVFIASIDEAQNHYDVRSIYTSEMGQALAQAFDKNVLQVAILAARASANISGGNGGTIVKAGPAVETDPVVLARAIRDAVTELYKKQTKQGDQIFCAVRPTEYMLLTENTLLINRELGGTGSFQDGKVHRVSGAQLVMTNNLPSTNLSQVTGTNNTYHGDFTNTVAAVWLRDAVGTVKLKDLAVEREYKIEFQGDLIVAKYAMGHGILRPERAVEISKASV
jgi:hypothetical protein